MYRSRHRISVVNRPRARRRALSRPARKDLWTRSFLTSPGVLASMIEALGPVVLRPSDVWTMQSAPLLTLLTIMSEGSPGAGVGQRWTSTTLSVQLSPVLTRSGPTDGTPQSPLNLQAHPLYTAGMHHSVHCLVHRQALPSVHQMVQSGRGELGHRRAGDAGQHRQTEYTTCRTVFTDGPDWPLFMLLTNQAGKQAMSVTVGPVQRRGQSVEYRFAYHKRSINDKPSITSVQPRSPQA